MTLKDAWRRLTGYFAAADRRVAIGNTVAAIVLGNQPFYPFYVWAAAGTSVGAVYLTWLSTPLFVAVPAAARRGRGWGRLLLLAAAIGNTALATRALGPGTAVELFYIPSLLVAWAVSRPGERGATMAAALAATVAGLVLGRLTGAPIAALSDIQNHALAAMHAISVTCLTAVIAFQAWRAGRSEAAPVSRTGPSRRS